MSALDDLRKKYNLESEEYYNVLSKHLEDQKYNKKTEAKNYANQYKKEKNILNQYQNTIQQEQRKLGIKSANELIQESWQEKTKLPVKTLDEIVNIPTKNDFEKFKDNQNKIDSYNNSNTKKEYDELQNQNKYTRYMKDLSEIDLENTTFSDKINIINQYLAGLESATSVGDYKDEKGNLIKLPSKNQLKAQKTSQDSEFIFKAIQSAANSLGAMTPAMIAGLTGIPGLSEAATYATTLNSAYNEKVLEGYSKEQARNYGLINAGLETFLGKVLGGTSKILTGKESVLSNSLGKLTDKLFNNKGLSYFISHLTSEEIEENLQTILDPINEYITLGKYDTIGEALSNISGEDIALTALSTLITIGVTEGPTAITKSRIDKINKQYNTDIKLKANENSLAEVVLNNKKEEKNTNESTRVEEANKEKNVNISNTVNEIQQQVEEIATGLSSETITNSVAQEQLTELQNGLTVLQRYNEQQSNALTTEALDRQNQEISILSSQINELQQAMGINQSPQLQQIEDKTAFSMPINKIEKGNIYTSKVNNQEVEFNVLDVANDKALIEITKSTLPTQQVGSKVTTSLNSPLIQNVVQPIDYINNVKYTPEIQKNINELVSTANTYLNKTQKANDIVKLLQKIIVNKGYSIRFNPNITNEQGVAVNGLIRKENGTTTIELNPNADNYVEFLIVHEITHDIATEEMKELILDYAKQDPNFNNALESLKEKYNTDDVTDEVVADVCAELFGNKEFIQSVAEKKPSLFKKILNNIRELAKKIKGLGANEYVSFVEKLKTMWEEAYYVNESNLGETKYSTIGLKGAKNLRKNNNTREYKNLFLRQKQAEDIHSNSTDTLDNTNIRSKRETGWYKTKYGDWGTLISDKEAKLIKTLEPNKTYKLGEILKHDLLYQAYPMLRKLKVKTADLSSSGAHSSIKWLPANNITNEIFLNNNDISKKDFKNTLLHEINHFIEHKEKYNKMSRGTNTKIETKDNYFNNLGEIISNETKINSNLTQNELNDIILPEQAKSKPEYKNIKEKLIKSNQKDTKTSAGVINALQNLEIPIQNEIKNNKVADKKHNKYSRVNEDLGELDNSSFSFKQKQLDIIKNNNPANDDYHTWIRNVEDIKTLEETINDSDYIDYDNYDPDLSRQDIENAIDSGKITVYSSYPIKQGVFVSPSKMEAESYSSNGKVYSKEVNINDVAWIDPTQGQYAKIYNIPTKYSIGEQQIKGLDYAIDHLNRSIELDNEIAKDKKEELNEKIKRWYDRELEFYKEAVNDGDIPEENLKDFLEHFENGNNIPYYEVESWQQLDNDGVEPFEGFDALVKEIEELEQSKDDNSNQNKILSALNETIDYLSKYFPKDKIEVDHSTQSNSVYVKVRGNEDTYTLRISDHHTPHYSYQGQWHDINNTWEHRIVDDYDKKASQPLKDDLKEFLDIIKEEEGGLLQFSQNNKEWNEYLKENFPSSGTKTKMSEIKAPIREDIKKNEINKETSIKNTEELAQILKERPITLQEKDNWLKKLATIKFIDKGYYVDKLARQTKNKELSSKYDYSLLANGIANQIIGNGRYDENGKKIGKGLFEIFEPIENSGLLDKFSEYIYHKHNIDRMSLTNRFSEENKAIFGNSVTEDISKEKVKELELQYPEFETWAEDIYSYNKANLEYLEKYGVLSKESVDYYNKKYPHYVPTIRDTTKTKTQIDMLVGKKARINTPIKKAKGGNQDIIPLKEAMALRTMQTINSALKNNFGLELMNTIETEVIKTKQDIESVVEEVGFEDLLSEKSKDNPAKLTIFENGEKVTFAIPDEIYEALKPSNIHTFKSLNKLNNIRRGLLTEYNPTFMITNPLKDIQDGSINSKHPKQFAKNLIEAVKQIKNNGQYKKLYIANGGAYETYFNYNTGTNIAPSKLDKIIPLKKISEANEIIEMTPRLAEFISSIEAGESIETAMYNAAEITTNFKRGGDFVKTLDRNGVTFLNAGVQGMVKQVRNIQEAKVQGIRGVAKLIVRSAVVGLVPTLIMGMIWDDDDDYNELSDYIKNNYYIIGKYDNGKFIKIPKGRILSILQSLFQNMINGIKGEKLDIEGLASLIENQLLPSDPTESNLLSPIAQAINNKTWYGGELVPKRLQNLPDGEQYDETTDSISIWLGKKLNLSPYKINYVLDQYSGALGDYILPYLTQEAESGSDSISGKLIAPIKDKFTTDSVLKNKNVSELYELSESYTKKANSSKSTDEDIIINKYINSVKSEISKLYAEKRKIQSSDLKDSEKFNKARDIQNQINEKAKDVLSNYNEVQIKNNYASVGNRQYYKNNKNEWQKVDNTTSKYKIATQITSYDKFLNYDNEIKKIKENSTNKKVAIINYVNSLELSIPQKAMLIKMNYSSFDNYDGEIRKYIDSKNLTNKEKQELYKDLKL